MPKYTAAQKAEVIKLYKSGMKTGQIAIKMKGVNPKTIASWITEYRKSTEFAIENSKPLADSLEKENEEALIEESSNATLADDFDPCEMMLAETPPIVVNADTDIKALQKAWDEYETKQKNEPAQAATCTDSGVENLDSISTPIINEKTEVVKRVFSESILDATYKLICDKQNEILAYNKKLEDMYKAQDTINSRIDATNDMIMYAEQELDRLWEDYAALCGEVSE